MATVHLWCPWRPAGGVAAMYINVPDFSAADPLTALAVGIVSGLAATGADQVIKQASKDN